MGWIAVLQKAKALAAVLAPIAGVALLHIFETVTGVTFTPEQEVALIAWLSSVAGGMMVYAVPNMPANPLLPPTAPMKALV